MRIIEKKCSLSAGPYFNIKIDYVNLTASDFNSYIYSCENNLKNLIKENNKLDEEIFKNLKDVSYNEKS